MKKKAGLIRQASYSSSHTTMISNSGSNFDTSQKPSAAYIPVTISDTTRSFASNPYKNSNFTESRSEISLQSSGSVQVFATQEREKSKRRVQERKHLLHKNNVYNERILRTLLRSNSKSKTDKAYTSQDYIPKNNIFTNGESKSSNPNISAKYKAPKQRLEKPYITHHNMPIHSKITKGVSKKLQLESSPKAVFDTEFRSTYRARIKPQSNFTASNTAFAYQ